VCTEPGPLCVPLPCHEHGGERARHRPAHAVERQNDCRQQDQQQPEAEAAGDAAHAEPQVRRDPPRLAEHGTANGVASDEKYEHQRRERPPQLRPKHGEKDADTDPACRRQSLLSRHQQLGQRGIVGVASDGATRPPGDGAG
jgi:hypothetical protein